MSARRKSKDKVSLQASRSQPKRPQQRTETPRLTGGPWFTMRLQHVDKVRVWWPPTKDKDRCVQSSRAARRPLCWPCCDELRLTLHHCYLQDWVLWSLLVGVLRAGDLYLGRVPPSVMVWPSLSRAPADRLRMCLLRSARNHQRPARTAKA